MKKRKVRSKLECILRKYTPKSSRFYGLVTHYKFLSVTYLHKLDVFFQQRFKTKKCDSKQTDRQTDRQTDSLYFSTMIIKAMQLVGSCINTKPKSEIYA